MEKGLIDRLAQGLVALHLFLEAARAHTREARVLAQLERSQRLTKTLLAELRNLQRQR